MENVEKIGWRKVGKELGGFSSARDRFGDRKEQIETLFYQSNKIFRFLNVRHPFARLNSAWRDKFTFSSDQSDSRNKKMHRAYAEVTAKIKNEFEDEVSLKTKKNSERVSFLAFLRFIA